MGFFKPLTQGLTLIAEKPARLKLFTRSPESDGSVREMVAPAPWPVCYWLIDSTTPVLPAEVTPSSTADSEPAVPETSPTLLTTAVEDLSEIQEAVDKWLPPGACHVILDPDVPESPMKISCRIDGRDAPALVDSEMK